MLQLARASDTGAALAQMAARFAGSGDALAGLVRSRQDLVAQLEGLDKQLLGEIGKPASQRQPGLEQRLRDDIAARTHDLEALSTDLTQRYSRNMPELGSPRPLPLAEARKLLGPDEALLAWAFGLKEAYLLVVRADQAAVLRLPLAYKQVSEDVAALRWALNPVARRFIRRRWRAASMNNLFR